MKGVQLTLFVRGNQMHGIHSLAQWLVEEARRRKMRGASMISVSEGFGEDLKLRSARFFELADQPIAVTMMLEETEADNFCDFLRTEKVDVFYVKAPVEFGRICEEGGTEA